MTTVARALDEAARELRRAGVPEAGAEARYLMCHLLGIDMAELLLRWDDPVPPVMQTELGELVRQRAGGEPFSYVTGDKEFYGRTFVVDERVLVPRPETETLVEFALELLGMSRLRRLALANGFVDLCTGSGVVGVTLACEEPGLSGSLIDIAPDALSVARLNATRLGVADRLGFAAGDLFEALTQLPGSVPCGLVTANPPYVSSLQYATLSREVRAEPREALVAGEDGLEVIERIVAQAPGYTVTGGWICLEIGAGQYERTEAAFVRSGAYGPVTSKTDLAGVRRVAGAEVLHGAVANRKDCVY